MSVLGACITKQNREARYGEVQSAWFFGSGRRQGTLPRGYWGLVSCRKPDFAGGSPDRFTNVAECIV
jgi:hypothetical protein